MAIAVRRLAPTFCGVDLRRLSREDTDAIKSTWLAHKVLVFPDHYARLMRRVGINFPADLRAPF